MSQTGKKQYRLSIDAERCKGCGLCMMVCKRNVLRFRPEPNDKGYPPCAAGEPESCIGCAMCAQVCPDIAIEVYVEGRTA